MWSFLWTTTFLWLMSYGLAQNSCYYAANKRAGSAIIPCDSNSLVSGCCQYGDLCLSDSACWNPEYNVTYLYGCSDSTYTDPSCPWKCGPDYESAPYVGLEYCSNTTQNQWACTHPPSDDDAIQPNPPQTCTDDSIVAFAGPKSLQPILSLPSIIGDSTVYFSEVNPTSFVLAPDYTPTTSIIFTASVPTTVQVVSPTSSTTTEIESFVSTSSLSSITSVQSTSPATIGQQSTTSSSSAPVSTSSTTNSGLSTGAKAGIGVGVGLGTLALVALAAAICFLRRRGRLHEPVRQTEESMGPHTSEIKEGYSRPLSELEGTTIRAGSGYGRYGLVSDNTKHSTSLLATSSPIHDELHEIG